MFWSYLLSPHSSDSPIPCSPLCPFFPTHQVKFVRAVYWTRDPQRLSGDILCKNWHSLFYKQLLVWGCGFMPASSLYGDIGRARAFLGLVPAVTVAVSSSVQLPCGFPRALFPVLLHCPWLLQSFSPFCHNESWTLGKRGMVQMSHLGLTILKSLIPCALASCGFLC